MFGTADGSPFVEFVGSEHDDNSASKALATISAAELGVELSPMAPIS
jgi:hypothetical protein